VYGVSALPRSDGSSLVSVFASTLTGSWFKILQRFRCGMGVAISMFKRCFMLGDIRVRGSTATALWVGWSIFSFNLWNFS
jgi:hypothetical protein